MNNSTLASADGSDPNLGDQGIGGFGYGLGLSIGVLVIFVGITYASTMCKRFLNNATDTSRAAVSDHDFSVVTIGHGGLDEATLSSFPQYIYSEVKPHRHEDNASVCSICLVDYRDADVLRLLPDCGHFFHIKCIDPWLILHPTCPVCRNSPAPSPLAPVAAVAPGSS